MQNTQDTTGLNRSWSQWTDFEKSIERGCGAPRQPGIYRICDALKHESLLYIGETNNIRGRLFQLRNAMAKVAAGGSQGPPHWAGGCILHHERLGARIQVSWLLEAVPDEAERKGLECEYIAAHRSTTGHNPECQFVALARRKKNYKTH
jgi:hypothetical protein